MNAPFPPSLINSLVPNPQTMKPGQQVIAMLKAMQLISEFYTWLFTSTTDANGNTIPTLGPGAAAMICSIQCSGTITRSTTLSTAATTAGTTVQSLAIIFNPTPGHSGANTNPYPSTRYFPTVVAVPTVIQLNISGFNSGYPPSIWIILQAPSGAAHLVMAGAGGNTVGVVSFGISNVATNAMGPSIPFVQTTPPTVYKKGLFGVGIGPYSPILNMPALAPQVPTATGEGWGPITGSLSMLALAQSGSTQGTWKLWVCDMNTSGAGSITDWNLEIY